MWLVFAFSLGFLSFPILNIPGLFIFNFRRFHLPDLDPKNWPLEGRRTSGFGRNDNQLLSWLTDAVIGTFSILEMYELFRIHRVFLFFKSYKYSHQDLPPPAPLHPHVISYFHSQPHTVSPTLSLYNISPNPSLTIYRQSQPLPGTHFAITIYHQCHPLPWSHITNPVLILDNIPPVPPIPSIAHW